MREDEGVANAVAGGLKKLAEGFRDGGGVESAEKQNVGAHVN